MQVKIEGVITIGDLIITAPPGDGYTGGDRPWISRADHHKNAGEGAALGPEDMKELAELLEVFYRKIL